MTRYIGPTFAALAAGLMTCFATGAAAQTVPGSNGETTAAVQVLGGTATFEAGTNIYYLLKIGSVTGTGLYRMGAQMRGEIYQQFLATRNISGAV